MNNFEFFMILEQSLANFQLLGRDFLIALFFVQLCNFLLKGFIFIIAKWSYSFLAFSKRLESIGIYVHELSHYVIAKLLFQHVS